MSYLQRNKPRGQRLKKALLLLVIFAVIIYLLSLVRIPLVSLASPIWKSENAVLRGLANSLSFFDSERELRAENEMLRAEILAYRAERANLGNWQEREAELLALLGRKLDRDGILAAVLAHPPQSPYDTIILDAGSEDGVVVGQEVRLPSGSSLGHVIETFSHKSKAKLYSAPRETMTAILERGSVSIELVGAGGGMFEFVVPREVPVEPGDRILSADIQSSLLAVARDISMRPTDSFKEVSAQSPGNIFGLRYVFIEQ